MTHLDPIIYAARKAALLARRVREAHFMTAEKKEDDPVTIADYGAQAILGRAIRESFPDDAIIAEEHGNQFIDLLSDEQRMKITRLLTGVMEVNVTEQDVVGWLEYGRGKSAARTWVIDPIDGTKGFISGRHYAVGVGLLEDGQPTNAVIAAPGYPHFGNRSTGALFYTKDGGAYVEPLSGGDPQPIRVSDRSEIESVRVVESVESRHKDLSKLEAMRENVGIQPSQITEIDSMEKYAWIAADHADLYVRLPRGEKPRHWVWDHAAGVALVRAAGGTATDLDGSPLDFSQGSALGNQGVITTNGRIHERMIKALQRALAE